MNFIKFFLLAALIITPFYAQAALIKASDFEVGTEISQLDSNTTVALLRGGSGTTQILTLPIQTKVFGGDPITNNFGGESWGLYWAFDRAGSRIESLNDLYSSWDGFSAIQINYTTPTRQLTVNGHSPYGDGFMALAFGENGEFLEYQPISGSVRCLGYSAGGGYCISGFAFGDTFHFEKAAHHIVIGGMFATTHIESIDTSLPEPSPLLLLALGGIALTLRSCQHSRKTTISRAPRTPPIG